MTRNYRRTSGGVQTREYKNKGKQCSIENCGNMALARTFCSKHYSRWAVTGNPLQTPTGKEHGKRRRCTIDGCDRLWSGHGYCYAHYRRWKRWGDPLKSKRPNLGKHRYTKEGYVLLFFPNHPNANGKGYVLEHRKVMSDYLKRPLLPTEIVHHKNGQRDDNRVKNLQVLTREKHPTGHEYSKCPSCGYKW